MASGERLLDLSPGSVHTPSTIGTQGYAVSPGETSPVPSQEGGSEVPRKPSPVYDPVSDIIESPQEYKAASLVLVSDKRGRILAVSRPEPPHEMSIPGGHVEAGETHAQAGARELAEECGVVVRDLALVAQIRCPMSRRPVSVFTAGSFTGEPTALEPDTRVAWMTPDDLYAQSVNFADSLKQLLPLFGGFNQGPSFGMADPRAAEKAKRDLARAARQKKTAAGRGKGTIHVRADLAPGGALHVRHNMRDSTYFAPDGSWGVTATKGGEFLLRDFRRIISGDDVDPATAGVQLVGPDKWSDGTAKKLTWVKLAECGAWKGHPSGEFEMTPATFSEIKANFESRDLPIQFDMEHYSELPADQMDPSKGAPAHGWVHRMDNRGKAGLYGLTEWLDTARDGIKAGRYAFLSPAIRFGAKDTVSGKPIGARMTSVAITNQPFLTGLGQLRAARLFGLPDDAVQVTPVDAAFNLGLAHHPNEYMPKIRACMGLHAACTAAECADRLSTIRGHYDADQSGDKDGHNEGVKLSDHMLPLRDFFGDAAMGMTWDDVFDRFQDMIDSAMDAHVDEYHSGGAQMRDAAITNTATPVVNTATTENEMDAKLLKDAEDKAKASEETAKSLKLTLDKSEADKAKLEVEVKTLSDKIAAGEKSVKDAEVANADFVEIITAVGSVALKDEKPTAVVLRLVEDNKKLLKDKSDREESDLQRDVQEVYETYKDDKKFSPGSIVKADDKKGVKEGWLLSLARTNRDAFNKEFPPIPADQRHLLRAIVPSEIRPTVEELQKLAKPVVPTSATELTSKLMTEKGLSYADAYSEASAIIAGKKTFESVKSPK